MTEVAHMDVHSNGKCQGNQSKDPGQGIDSVVFEIV